MGGSVRWQDPSVIGPFDPWKPTLAYDPELDQWRELPPVEMTSPWMVMVATDRLVVAQGDDPSRGLAVEIFYNSTSPSWESAGGPPLSVVRAAVNLGPRILIAGSEMPTDPETAEVQWPFVPRLVAYDPFNGDGTWVDLGAVPGGREVDRLVRTGEGAALALSGSSMSQGGKQVVWAVDGDAGTWRELPYSGLDDIEGAAVAWTGTELLVWGGGILGGYG